MKTAFRAAMLALTVTLGTACATQADELETVSNYMNSIRTAEGPFVQYNPDGTTSSGRFYLSRPGQMRLDYDGPTSPLMIVGRSKVAVFDRAYRHNKPQQYPLYKTPLGPLLARTVDLTKSPMIVGKGSNDDKIVVLARDPKHPEYGTAKFSFSKEPVALTGWTMTDEVGATTHIAFGNLEMGKRLPSSLFSIEKQMEEDNRR